ncbi:MAG: hypothetical protein AAB225_09545 [Acidobacteriota bacterium]
MRLTCLLVLSAVAAYGAENAVYDSNGRMTAMIYGGDELAVRTDLVAPVAGWSRLAGLAQSTRTEVTRGDGAAAWKGVIEIQPGKTARSEQTAREDGASTRLTVQLTADAELDLEGVFFRIDLPRVEFAGGRGEFQDGAAAQTAALPVHKPPQAEFFRGHAATLAVTDAGGNLKLSASLSRVHAVSLRDTWDRSGRAYSLWIELHRGALAAGATASAEITLSLTGRPDSSPARLTLDASRRRYRLHGFGGNYCFNIESPVTQYTLKNLRVAWARTEMTPAEWEPENDNDSPADTNWEYLKSHDRPDTNLRREFLLAKQIQEMGIPYVISIWRLPEWLYTDPGKQGPQAQRRRVAPEKWNELLECLGSYLLHARQQYGVEPDLFSFNEANIGVYVLFTPEEHREALKSIGAHFEKLGLKTRMLLADATGPRGTHEYALAAASDPEAMRYAGAVAFHSWGGATAEQYAAWGDLAEWLQLPLLVAELGVDAAAWRGRVYDSFHYGVREVRMYQELLLHARPQGAMQWEFTSDYSMVRTARRPDGGEELTPTHRFWFIKHFTDLTPANSDALATTSNHAKVLFTAFTAASGGRRVYALHVANLAAAREITLQGVPAEAATLRAWRTSETEAFRELGTVEAESGVLRLQMPPRSLLTLVGPAE